MKIIENANYVNIGLLLLLSLGVVGGGVVVVVAAAAVVLVFFYYFHYQWSVCDIYIYTYMCVCNYLLYCCMIAQVLDPYSF